MTELSPSQFPDELRPRYTPVSILGMGGMGVVVLAVDRELGREVVVKLTLAPRDPRARQRALREAQALAQLRHPNVLTVFEAGDSSLGPYLVMERMEGGSLADHVGQLDLVDVFRQAAAGLDAVHLAGLVHRDVKPGNILVTHEGRAVLADFGLVHDPNLPRMTATGQVVGTMAFLAPEILAGEPSQPASDWYGWGASLYACLEGHHPFSPEELVQHVCAQAPLVLRLGATPPGILREALEATLRAVPEQRRRPSTLLGATGIEDLPPLPTRRLSTAPAAAVPPAPSPRPGSRKPWAPVLLVLGLGVGGGLLAGRLRSPEAAAAPAATSEAAPPPSVDRVRAHLEESLAALGRAVPRDFLQGERAPDTTTLATLYPVLVSLRFEALYRRFLEAAEAWIQDPAVDQDALAFEELVQRPAAQVARALEELTLRLRTGESRFHLTVEIHSGLSLKPFLAEWDHEAVRERTGSLATWLQELGCRLDGLSLEARPRVARLAADLLLPFDLTAPSTDCAGPPDNRVLRYLGILHEAFLQAGTASEARPFALSELHLLGRVQDAGLLDAPTRLRHLEELHDVAPRLEEADTAWMVTFQGEILAQLVRCAFVHPEMPRGPLVERAERAALEFLGMAPAAPELARPALEDIQRTRAGYLFIEVPELRSLFRDLDDRAKVDLPAP